MPCICFLPTLDASQSEQPAEPHRVHPLPKQVLLSHQFYTGLAPCALGLLLERAKRKKTSEPTLSVWFLWLTGGMAGQATSDRPGKGLSASAPLTVGGKVSWRREG